MTKPTPVIVGLVAAAALTGCGAHPAVWNANTVYVVHRTPEPIAIGRRPDPRQWARAMVITDFVAPVTRKPAAEQTRMRMLWDDRCLYVWFLAADADLHGTYTGKADPLWREDVVEVFLQPDPKRKQYFEFEVNPIGTLLALRIPEGHTTFQQRAEFDHGVRTATTARGTPNDSKDTDRSFEVILAIPWNRLDFAGGKAPAIGEVWRFIGARCNLASKGLDKGREFSACVGLSKVDFHLLAEYPRMRFAE